MARELYAPRRPHRHGGKYEGGPVGVSFLVGALRHFGGGSNAIASDSCFH
jgi:hypothetical protein